MEKTSLIYAGGGAMEVFVEKDKNNPLLKRREVYFRLRYDEEKVTPS